jgi:hypothetical protein
MSREAERQSLLLRALWREADAHTLPRWLLPGAETGLAIYRSNAGAVAERALASTYPTLAALVGDESFGALARELWQRHPPNRGDLGEWGDALPGFVAGNTQLASEPYLADVARLEWQVHTASRAADDDGAALDLQALAQHEPSHLRLVLRPGSALVQSAWPIVAIWRAHQRPAGESEDRFAEVRAAFAGQRHETAWVRREGYTTSVDALDEPTAAFTQALLAGRTLADALDLSGSGFQFDRWLAQALPARWIVAITLTADLP